MAPVLVVPAFAQMAMGVKPAAFARRTACASAGSGSRKSASDGIDHDALAPHADDAGRALDCRVGLVAQEDGGPLRGAGLLARGDERIEDGRGAARREEAAGRAG